MSAGVWAQGPVRVASLASYIRQVATKMCVEYIFNEWKRRNFLFIYRSMLSSSSSSSSIL